ncbi:hypothetical protein BEN47_08970 [Hymenobacter lapidarius]|uniref:Glycerophosphoryl diester phosphodiesterase membrane domain-containing protein n=1 Tax=Hymenobacter lapidarius TaxID=1908237 RepID=A0A1G1TC68_9BACT|nr:hypothetical protein [Hymenobacter lapidarius]OGX88460.1 hypothetical protein BEN47_08970 [Hymenobacter lapidarius]
MQPVGKFTQEADFRRERDFGAKVGATFEFVVAQFRPLFKCIAYFVLPGALLGGIGLGLAMGNFMSGWATAAKPNGGPEFVQNAGFNTFTGTSFVGMALAGIGFLTAFLLLSSVVYGFVRVRMRTPAQETVQPAQVWAFVWKRLGSVLGAWLLLGIVLVIGTGVLGGALGLAGPGFVGLLFFPLIWVVVCLTLYFPVLMMEDNGVAAAFRRSFYLMKGKWWSSLGLYMVMSLIMGIVNYVFIIPLYALMIGRTLLGASLNSEILNIGAMTIYGMGWIFTATLPLVAMLFQYFNLVERKEGVGLRLMVDSLGLGAAPQVRNAAYQPDEEGEY